MCQLCNGTHVIHEISSFGYKTSCCPLCGTESEEVWRQELLNILQMEAVK